MSFEEFAKLLNRTLLLSLDRINGPSLVRMVYLLGLAVAALWGVSHIFATFRSGFGDGLWGLLEIGVYGLFGLSLLRVVCEALIVYFEANKDAMATATRAESSTNLIDEVRDAIEQLSEDEKDEKALAELEAAKPLAKSAAPAKTGATKRVAAKTPTAKAAAKPAARATKPKPRTAKRTPRPKAGSGEG
jgi:hypothetical protein